MKYSVLMSVYKNDNPDFLKIALESIYEDQTRKPDEIVVVFDGPLEEGHYKVLENFRKGKEDFCFYYPQEVNKGLGEALRIGSEKCTGDYILRMDSDDISVPERFEKQISYIEQHPEIDVLGSNIAEFNESIEEEMRIRVCPQEHNNIVEMAKTRNPMNHVTTCIKKSALLKCGGYSTLLFAEDYFLWLKMIASNFKLENIHESMVLVRTGEEFNLRRGSKIRIKSWSKLQKFMLEHKLINKFKAFLNMIYIYGITYCPNFIRKYAYEKILRKNTYI